LTTLTEIQIPIVSEMDIVAARQQGRDMARRIGFSGLDLTAISTAISEVARNIVEYALPGNIQISTVEQNSTQGIMVIAQDEGPGIPNLVLAMQDGYSSGRGLGLGLPGSRRLMDEFDIRSAPGRGTTVTMRKWRR
jgi:serine/threonine-protein kinase RsbT